jgi:glycosyltransferase involved in cell wall biosynthesis
MRSVGRLGTGPRVLLVGGSDHALRIPFLLRLRTLGVQVVAAGTGDAGPFEQADVPFKHYHFDRLVNPGADWRATKAVRRIIEDVRPDIVQSFDTKPNLIVPFAVRGLLPRVLVVRTVNGLGWLFSSRTAMALALQPVYRWLYWMTAAHTSATVFQNRDDQVLFENGHLLGRSVSRLIPGSGVDPDDFDRACRQGPTGKDMRAKLGFVANEVVMTVSRMTREKGIPMLLQAAAIVHRSRPQVRFVLVGPRETEGPMAVSQSEIDAHAPYVVALGARSDVPSLLGMADVFAFPSLYREGVPRVLLEASLGRVPMISTDMPGCNDVIQDGWSGRLIRSKAREELHMQMAAGILALLQDRAAAAAMAERARQHVVDQFSLQKTVGRYVQLYQELLTQSGRFAEVDIASAGGVSA